MLGLTVGLDQHQTRKRKNKSTRPTVLSFSLSFIHSTRLHSTNLAPPSTATSELLPRRNGAKEADDGDGDGDGNIPESCVCQEDARQQRDSLRWPGQTTKDVGDNRPSHPGPSCRTATAPIGKGEPAADHQRIAHTQPQADSTPEHLLPRRQQRRRARPWPVSQVRHHRETTPEPVSLRVRRGCPGLARRHAWRRSHPGQQGTDLGGQRPWRAGTRHLLGGQICRRRRRGQRQR
jgi:hypothetical protein